MPEEFGVDFDEVEYPKTIQDQIMKDQFDLEENLTTRARIMVRDNKDLTVEEAQKIIEENKKINEQGKQQSISIKRITVESGVGKAVFYDGKCIRKFYKRGHRGSCWR